MFTKDRYFLIKDLGVTTLVETATTQKDIFGWLDDMIDNLSYGYDTDDTYEILYKDGSSEYINRDYDGHKIRRNNIKSMVYSNDCSYIVYGSFYVNEYGVVTANDEMYIDNSNIVEVDHEIY